MAPLPELITDLGWEFINSLPNVVRDDPDYIAVMHCSAKECELIEEKIEYVRAQLNPVTATEAGLAFFEAMLRLPVSPSGAGVASRRAIVLDRWHSLDGDPAGRDWVERVSKRLGPGAPWSYEEHIPGDGTSPAAQTLRITLPYASGSDTWEAALRVLREETPSELALTFISSGGFQLDDSQMDVEGMGV